MMQYKNNAFNLSDNPHVFAVAHEAYSELYLGRNQSLIIRYVFYYHCMVDMQWIILWVIILTL
jgi:hypothetical protein